MRGLAATVAMSCEDVDIEDRLTNATFVVDRTWPELRLLPNSNTGTLVCGSFLSGGCCAALMMSRSTLAEMGSLEYRRSLITWYVSRDSPLQRLIEQNNQTISHQQG